MATPAQAAAATVGAGSLAAAGAYGITQVVNGSGEETTTEESSDLPQDNRIPTPVTFQTTDTFSEGDNKGKLISIFKVTNLPYLVKSEGNEEWWKWAYENKFSKNKEGKGLDTLFTSVDDSEKLKEACKNAYKSETSKYSFAQNEHLLQNISDYCTKGEATFDISEPKFTTHKSTSNPTGYDHSVLTISENRDRLVKSTVETNEQTNEYWWKWSYEKHYKNKNSDVDTVFQASSVTVDFASTGNNSLNHACNEAYKKTHTELSASTNKLLNNIKQFCSTDRTQELKLPEPKVETTDLVSKTTSDYSSNKLIEKNENKLVDPSKSQTWWEWVFQNKFPTSSEEKTALPDPFKHVTSGHSTSAGTGDTQAALNQACKEAYKKSTFGQTSDNNSLIKKIKEYCSPSTISGDLVLPS